MSQENVEIVRRVVEAFNEGGMGSEATLARSSGCKHSGTG